MNFLLEGGFGSFFKRSLIKGSVELLAQCCAPCVGLLRVDDIVGGAVGGLCCVFLARLSQAGQEAQQNTTKHELKE